ncbi:MAG: DNA recombination protein RmuC [bacterium]|jgi:DNA recombination protein RmuC
MDWIFYLIFLIVGLAVGYGSCWLGSKAKLDAAVRNAVSRAESEIVLLNERLGSRDAELQSALNENQERIQRIDELTAAAKADAEEISKLRERASSQEAFLEHSRNEALEWKTKYAEQIELTKNLEKALAAASTALDDEKRNSEEKLALLEAAKQQLKDAFSTLSADALSRNARSFLELAKENLGSFNEQAKNELELGREKVESLVKPLKEKLEEFSAHVREIEESRIKAYATLTEQIRNLQEAEKDLHAKADSLTSALRGKPTMWGSWGEMQLKRVVELAGMTAYCDFAEQVTVSAGEARFRPDMVIKMPAGHGIPVDSKAPLEAYISAYEAESEEMKAECLKRHAANLKTHINQLASKGYWDFVQGSPDFVIMFLPFEDLLMSALKVDPDLISYALDKRVLPANPAMLMGLLKTVAFGWRQEQIAENAKQISNLGKELYNRIRVMAEHFNGVKKGLDGAVESYNRAVGSLESRVLPQARKFKELDAGIKDDILELEQVERTPKSISIPDA